MIKDLFTKYGQQNRAGLADFHVHTSYCDGKCSPKQMIEAALAKGMKTLGFSGHSFVSFDTECGMTPEETELYRDEIRTLAAKYSGRLEILCGLEQDRFSCLQERGWCSSDDEWDYVIGSCHYIECNGTYFSVDDTEQIFRNAIEYFDGDVYSVAEYYFRAVTEICEVMEPDIIGHFDLVTKFNTGGENGGSGKFFDESHPRYVSAWQCAADQLLKRGIPFEINTGAVSGGYRQDAYPANPIRDYLAERGAKFILSSDSHRAETLCFEFEKYR